MKKIIIVILLLISFAFGMLSTSLTEAGQTKPLKIWPQNENGLNSTLIIVDENTGVNYVVVKVGNYGGVSITPRLDKDGSLYISK